MPVRSTLLWLAPAIQRVGALVQRMPSRRDCRPSSRSATSILWSQPGTNDLRFGGSKHQRATNISAIVDQLLRRQIRVIVYDPVIPRNFLQWDGIHFTLSCITI